MEPDLTRPVSLTSNRRFPDRLAEGVSQPPWSSRTGLLAVVVSFAGIICLPNVFGSLRAGGWHDADFIWPSLICHFPLLCCVGCLARQARTSADTLFGLRGARVGKVMISGLLLFVLGSLLTEATGAVFGWLGLGTGTGDEEQAKATASSFFHLTDTLVWAPFCEELACRALLYTSLRIRSGIATSSAVTAAVFVVMHTPGSLVDAGVLFFCGVEFPLV